MNRKMVIFGVGAMLVAVSCGFLTRSEQAPTLESNQSELSKVAATNNTKAEMPAPGALPNSPEPPANPVPSPTKIVTHYDTQLLDDKVREEALKLGKDPATYRRLVRSDADGTKIYRQIGMHVIVAPNNEESFLPDEI